MCCVLYATQKDTNINRERAREESELTEIAVTVGWFCNFCLCTLSRAVWRFVDIEFDGYHIGSKPRNLGETRVVSVEGHRLCSQLNAKTSGHTNLIMNCGFAVI